ncbi:MAG TPA: hypothetical protein VK524_28160 [Polyangiaceae bacterium]|nr:hypothetical protein [Polyangiaceae bacterium]
MTTLYWDFFGGRAEGTAKHFQKHLDEFLQKNACTGSTTGVESNGDGQYSVFCRAPSDHVAAIQRTLKPQRAVAGEGR